MRRIALCSTLLGLFLSASILASNRPRLMDSVKALAWETDVQVGGDEDEGGGTVVKRMNNHCTITSIDSKRHYWLTAAHCVIDGFPSGDVVYRPYFIGDESARQPAVIVAVDVPDDLAILQSALPARSLKMQDHEVEWGQKVKVAGHPFGWPEPTLFFGFVANPVTQFTDADKPYMILQLAGAPGNSGSAIVNEHDEVVSVLQISWTRSFGNVMGGSPWTRLARFAGAYFG